MYSIHRYLSPAVIVRKASSYVGLTCPEAAFALTGFSKVGSPRNSNNYQA